MILLEIGLRTKRYTLSTKRLTWTAKGWCLWYHSNEAGMRVVQVGPLVLEITTGEKANGRATYDRADTR